MTNKALLDLIGQGEGVTIEFKECKNEVASEVYPTVCSFSNRFGGHIFMGVADNGEIIGVNPKTIKDMRKNFSNMLNNPQKISPSLFLSAEEYEIDGKLILYVYVPKSSQVHTCSKIVYDRIEDADVDITKNTSQMAELYLRKQTDFTEKKLFPYITTEHLRMDLLPLVRKLAKSKDQNHPWIAMDDMELFRSAGLYEQDYVTGQSGFNLAAVLLFGKDETIKSCLPAYRTDAVLRVDNTDRYDDRDDVRTNLIEAYDRLISFICKHTDDRFYLDGIQRVSVRSIIAREIVSNMLMHREYANPFPAKLIIEKSRIYTENANKVYRYGQIKADNFTPYPKNPIIANFFANIGRADELGSGVRNLYKYTKIYAGGDPVLFEDDIFKIEIPIEDITEPLDDDKTVDKPLITVDKPLINNQEQLVIDYITENGFITNSTACQVLNTKSTRTRDILNAMVDKNILTAIGERKTRQYILK